MTTITLPPLPDPDMQESNPYEGSPYNPYPGKQSLNWYSPASIRARDLEVARVVLEGAANLCYDQRGNWSVEGVGQVALENAADAIQKLEVKHHE
jgi:hypothetical protein